MGRSTDTDATHPAWTPVRRHLENRKRSISEEMRNYPQPIAGCDDQFNHLAEQRTKILDELDRLDAARRACPGRTDAVDAVDEFIRSSTVIDDDAEREIRAALGAVSNPL